MNNNAHRRCLYLNFLDAQGASIAVQVARGVDVDAIEIEGVSARDGGAGLDAVQAVALRVCDLNASGQVQAQHQQQLISGVRYRELVQHGGDDSHRGLRPFIHDVLSGVDAHIAAKAGFGCKGNGDRLIPQPESVHRVFTDLMSTMHDAWGHIHECGSEPVRRQWIELIRAYGEHAETPLTPSKAGNAKLSAALRDGSKYVLSHSFLSQTLRTKYERVLERHSGKLSENIQHQIAVTEADFLIDHPTGNSRSVVGLRSPLAFEDAQGQALRSPVELGVHLVPGIRFYEQGFEPVRDSLGLDGYWYPIRRARGPSEVSLTEEVTWEEVKPEPQALQELRAASEDFISAIASQKRQFASYQHADQAAICELFEAIESGGLRPQHLDSFDHVLKRFSEFEPPGKMKSVPAQRMLSAVTQNLDEHVRFARSFIPQPGADEQTLSPQEVAAWRESEISDSGIKALAECGGMSVIRWRSDFRRKLQGVLGRGFDYRIIAVRNALRDQDWVGQPYKKLSKTVGGVEYTLETRMNLERGGQAITLLDFGVRSTLTGTTHYLSDDMDRSASDLARAVNALVQPPVLSTESTIMETLPSRQSLVPDNLKVAVYFDAHCTDEHDTGPEFARVLVDAPLVKRLLTMQALCKMHRLSEVRTEAMTDAWGPGDIESDARLVAPELVVTENHFWFRADRKHANVSFETELETVDTFAEKISKAANGVPLYFGGDIDQHESVRTWQLELGHDEPPCVPVDGYHDVDDYRTLVTFESGSDPSPI